MSFNSQMNNHSQIHKIEWPGYQINDINQFREDCYKKCHEQNPTDSGWYEKTDECGQKCKNALKQFEYTQGKNPCELRLQAPVFWFQNDNENKTTEHFSSSNENDIYEHFVPSSQNKCHECSSSTSIHFIYIFFMLFFTFLIFFYIFLYIYKN